jgi:hypothetical protein
LSGIVVSSLFRFLTGQGLFLETQSAREEVQQNTRAALELVSSELRTVPAGEALVVATGSEITFRAARIWGVICSGGGASLDVVFPQIAGVSAAVNSGTGVIVNLGTAGSPLWSNAVAVTTNGIGASSSTCGGANLPAGVERRTLTLSGTPQNGSTQPAVGNVLYIYDQVSYRASTSAGMPGRWIQRQVGSGAYQPLAGPIVEGANGLRFEYFAAGSSTPISTPIADASTRASVRKIAVTVESINRNSAGSVQEMKADTAVVPLRNRT